MPSLTVSASTQVIHAIWKHIRPADGCLYDLQVSTAFDHDGLELRLTRVLGLGLHAEYDHAIAVIDGRALIMTRSDRGALIRLIDHELRALLRAVDEPNSDNSDSGAVPGTVPLATTVADLAPVLTCWQRLKLDLLEDAA